MLTFPLLDYGSIQAATRAARAALDEQSAVLDETRRKVRLDVETACILLEQARSAVRSFEDGRLDRARELLEMLRVGYGRGASSYLELLDAQRTWHVEQTDYVRAITAYNAVLATLRRAVGGALP